MSDALIALGGNIGDVRATLDHAIAALCRDGKVRLRARSSDYRTPPWGDEDQPAFINACIAVDTELSPHALLERAHAVERSLGRDRAHEHRWGPRTIDIDILAYDDVAMPGPTSRCRIRVCSSAPSCWCRWPRSRPTASSAASASAMSWRRSTPRASNAAAVSR